MVVKALLIRPNVAALRLVGIRAGSLSFFRGTSAMMTKATTSYNLSSSRSLFTAKLPLSCSSYPIRRNFCVRATAESGDAASIESLMESMEKKIKEQLSAESVVIRDAYGDGRHVSIDVISSTFEGVSAVNRQRMVYKAIWEELQEKVHAVDQMTTRTPSEVAPGK